MFDHGPVSNALRAALTASSTSALSPSAISARTSSVAGLRVSKVLPDLGATHLPPMSNFLGEALRKFNAALDRAPPPALSTDGVVAAIASAPFSSMAWRHGCECHCLDPCCPPCRQLKRAITCPIRAVSYAQSWLTSMAKLPEFSASS